MSEFYQMPGSLEGRRPKVNVTKSCMVEIVAYENNYLEGNNYKVNRAAWGERCFIWPIISLMLMLM